MIKCPICIPLVEGENVDDLSENMEFHQIEVYCWTLYEKKEQAFEVGDARTMAGMGGEWVQGKLVKDSGSEESRGIHTEEGALDCPICKERVTGGDEESLSENFGRHMMTKHKDEPFVTRMLEEMKNR